MPSPSFSYEQPLQSLRVTKDFLASLEQYLLKKVIETSIASAEEAETCLTIKIVDSLGSERLNSISQLDSTNFADSTAQIEVELETPYRRDGSRLKIRLNFAKSRLFSTVAISATAPNAKELVLGLKDGIMRTLEHHRTWHWICHPIAQVWGLVFGAGTTLGIALYRADGKDTIYPFLLGIFFLVFLYLFQLGSLRPYTVFDTRAAERSDKIWNWFITGLGTFVLFGTLFTLLRRPLLGF
jgi:hypothetical protein